jgi:hypothetical protein
MSGMLGRYRASETSVEGNVPGDGSGDARAMFGERSHFVLRSEKHVRRGDDRNGDDLLQSVHNCHDLFLVGGEVPKFM